MNHLNGLSLRLNSMSSKHSYEFKMMTITLKTVLECFPRKPCVNKVRAGAHRLVTQSFL